MIVQRLHFSYFVSSLKSENRETTLLSDADGMKYSISEEKRAKKIENSFSEKIERNSVPIRVSRYHTHVFID